MALAKRPDALVDLPPEAARRRAARGPFRVERLMGTVVTIDVRDPAVAPGAVDAVIAHLRDVEARFSLFGRIASQPTRAASSPGDCGPEARALGTRGVAGVAAAP
jgi:hypothetical protein